MKREFTDPKRSGSQSKSSSQDGLDRAELLQLKRTIADLSISDQKEAIKPARPLAQPPVQAKGATADAETIKAAAAEGVKSGGGALPHSDAIQASFGRHDVSDVQAHVGGGAQKASQSMGAAAYTTGNKVAFKSSPDLHTAAHEAAHVVQQRSGVQLRDGVGQSGDRDETLAATSSSTRRPTSR